MKEETRKTINDIIEARNSFPEMYPSQDLTQYPEYEKAKEEFDALDKNPDVMVEVLDKLYYNSECMDWEISQARNGDITLPKSTHDELSKIYLLQNIIEEYLCLFKP